MIMLNGLFLWIASNVFNSAQFLDVKLPKITDSVYIEPKTNIISQFKPIPNEKRHRLSPNQSIVFITDICGFIGFHIALRLISGNIKVIGIDGFNAINNEAFTMKHERLKMLKKHKYNYNILDILYGNLTDKEYLSYIFEQYQITHILHFNHYNQDSVESYFETNTKALINLFECILSVYTKRCQQMSIIYASVLSIDTDSFAIQSNINSLLLQVYHNKYDLSITSLQFLNVYGEFAEPNDFYFKLTESLFFASAKSNTIKMQFAIDEELAFVYISDAVDALISALDYGYKYAEFNISSTKLTNIGDIINEIKAECSKYEENQDVIVKYQDITNSIPPSMDVSLSQQYLNYTETVSMKHGIKRFVQWYYTKWYQRTKYIKDRKKNLLLNCILNPSKVPDLSNYWNHHRHNKKARTLPGAMNSYYKTFKAAISNEKDLKFMTDVVIFTDYISWEEQISNPGYNDVVFINVAFDFQFRYHRAYNDVRFIWWYQYLNRFKSMYKYVLISDLFDVQFGRNPFGYMQNVIAENQSLVISGKEDGGVNKREQWRKYMYNTMMQCYGAAVWHGPDLYKSEFMYNPGSGIGGHAATIAMILEKIVLYEMPYVVDAMCDVNMVHYAKTMQTMHLNGNITVLDLNDWNSPFKKYENYTDKKYVVYHK